MCTERIPRTDTYTHTHTNGLGEISVRPSGQMWLAELSACLQDFDVVALYRTCMVSWRWCVLYIIHAYPPMSDLKSPTPNPIPATNVSKHANELLYIMHTMIHIIQHLFC